MGCKKKRLLVNIASHEAGPIYVSHILPLGQRLEMVPNVNAKTAVKAAFNCSEARYSIIVRYKNPDSVDIIIDAIAENFGITKQDILRR
jgi:hypothetical protein